MLRRRAGRSPKLIARKKRRDFIRRNKRLLFLMVLLYGVVTVVVLLTPLPGLPLSFKTGALLVGFVWWMSAVLSTDKTPQIRMGAEAEKWTSSAFRKLRRKGWQRVDRLVFDDCEVDHVVFGPLGVLAVETKYTTLDWETSDDGLRVPMGEPLDQVRREARKVRLLLRTGGLQIDVRPVLVAWGYGTRRVKSQDVDGVALLVGRENKEWEKYLPVTQERLTEEQVVMVRRVLEDFVAMRDANEKQLASLTHTRF